MPGWQSELEALLSQLHVSLESGRLPSQTTRAPRAPAPSDSSGNALDEDAIESDADGYLPLDLDALPSDEVPADGEEVHAVSSEIEATVRRVIAMARAGQMETSLRDDVVFVLQALTRPSPYDKPGKRSRGKAEETYQEWQLASAAAVLRFCRIVLRLTDALAREAEP